MNEALYRLEAVLCESDYERVCKFLALRHRKRSLIVILTDVIDTRRLVDAAGLHGPFCPLSPAACASRLRNLQVERLAAAEPREPADCFSKTAALRMLARRAEALGHMRQSGVDVLDVDPGQLTPQLISRYLSLKARKQF